MLALFILEVAFDELVDVVFAAAERLEVMVLRLLLFFRFVIILLFNARCSAASKDAIAFM